MKPHSQYTRRRLVTYLHKLRRFKWIFAFLVLTILLICYSFGLHAYLIAENYYTRFNYPLEGDIRLYVHQIRSGKQPIVKPINKYNYTFVLSNDSKCLNIKGKADDIRLLILIKSAISNVKNRHAIRESWGWENRFSDVKVRRIFLIGSSFDQKEMNSIKKENERHGDIVLSDFIDNYYNNTIKTMLGFKWAVEKCASSDFYFFSDDDMYVSIKNVLRYVRNPYNYPRYLTRAVLELQVVDIDETPRVLYGGHVFFSSPLRIKTSKWYVSLDEYSYSKYPPFVAAGAYVVSREALYELYYTSLYTRHFKFDDVFLGLVAKKAGIAPSHNDNFYFWKKDYDKFAYKYVVASHGYEKVDELLGVWHEQRGLGNA